MFLRRFLRRHAAEIGVPLGVYRHRFAARTLVLAGLVWVIMCALLALNPKMTPGTFVAACLVAGVALGTGFLLKSAEVLVVCERALVVGASDLLREPFIVRYEHIVPGSLVPVTGAQRYPSSTKRYRMPSAIRYVGSTRWGIHFIGPHPRTGMRGRRSRWPGVGFASVRSPDGGWVWFAGTGTTPPHHVTRLVAEAAGRTGLTRLAAATAAAPARELTGNRDDTPRLLPGFPPRP